MYTKILVPLDGSELAECVIPYVKWFTTVSDVSEIVLLRIVESFHMRGELETAIIPEERENIENDASKLARDYLDAVALKIKDSDYKIEPVVIVGKPVKKIAEYVANCDVDLIIMATHGFSGIHRWMRGSVADEILHSAMVPVLLVKPKDKTPDK